MFTETFCWRLNLFNFFLIYLFIWFLFSFSLDISLHLVRAPAMLISSQWNSVQMLFKKTNNPQYTQTPTLDYVSVQRKYLQHLKQSGALTMGRMLCLHRSTIQRLEQWCIRGLIVVLLWLCKVLVVHRFLKREQFVIQRPAPEIPMYNFGLLTLAIQIHYEYGLLNRRLHWMDSKYYSFGLQFCYSNVICVVVALVLLHNRW